MAAVATGGNLASDSLWRRAQMHLVRGQVREPEATLRKVFSFCGLEWEPGCMDLTRNTAPSATLSAAQVRSPVHGRAFGEWRRYEAQLENFEAAFAALGKSTQSGAD